MRDKLAQMGYTGVQVSHLLLLYLLSSTCELSLLLKLLSLGISRELCRVGVPRGPGWKMKNRTCDQDLSRHNNWCLHLIFISISERRRIVFLPCWLGEPWQKCIGRGRRKDCDHLHWMREIFIAGLAALSVCLLMPLASKVSTIRLILVQSSYISPSRHPGHCWFCQLQFYCPCKLPVWTFLMQILSVVIPV